jgi:hypothetical protein
MSSNLKQIQSSAIFLPPPAPPTRCLYQPRAILGLPNAILRLTGRPPQPDLPVAGAKSIRYTSNQVVIA